MHSPSATCSQHALREAVGICVRCRASMCSECITKIDGINYCRPCLESLVSADQAQSRTPSITRVPAWLSLSFGCTVLVALAWAMLEVLMPGSAP